MNIMIPDAIEPKIRSICMNEEGKSLVVGTFGSEIYEFKTDDPISKNTIWDV
jgi:hypothetical protein